MIRKDRISENTNLQRTLKTAQEDNRKISRKSPSNVTAGFGESGMRNQNSSKHYSKNQTQCCVLHLNSLRSAKHSEARSSE